jgi:hypothetical protein
VKSPPALDPCFPHHTSFVSDRNPLKDGILSKSELVAILGLAFVFANGALQRDDLPFIIPVRSIVPSFKHEQTTNRQPLGHDSFGILEELPCSARDS